MYTRAKRVQPLQRIPQRKLADALQLIAGKLGKIIAVGTCNESDWF